MTKLVRGAMLLPAALGILLAASGCNEERIERAPVKTSKRTKKRTPRTQVAQWDDAAPQPSAPQANSAMPPLAAANVAQPTPNPGGGPPPQATPAGGSPPAEEAWTGPVPSVKDIMSKLTKGPQSLTPTLGRELQEDPVPWDAVQAQTREYARLASVMGKNDPPKGSKESWSRLTLAYADAAAALDRASQAKDADAALTAHSQLASSCMGCHREHRQMGRGGMMGGGMMGGGMGGPGFGGPPGGGYGGGPPGGGYGAPPGGPAGKRRGRGR